MLLSLLLLLALLAIAYAAHRTLEFIRRLDADLDTPLPLAFEDPNSIKPVSCWGQRPAKPNTAAAVAAAARPRRFFFRIN